MSLFIRLEQSLIPRPLRKPERFQHAPYRTVHLLDIIRLFFDGPLQLVPRELNGLLVLQDVVTTTIPNERQQDPRRSQVRPEGGYFLGISRFFQRDRPRSWVNQPAEPSLHHPLLQLPFIVMVDTREVYEHVALHVLVGSDRGGEPIVPQTRLVDDVFLVFFLAENPFHGILLNVSRNVDFGVEPGQSVCIGECIDDPFVYAAKENAGVEAADIFSGENFDIGEYVVVGWREKDFPLDIGV